MKIFLACPYTGTPEEMKARFAVVTKYAGELMSLGKIVFSPITHGHAISKFASVPLTFEFWRNLNDSFIDWCDEVHVLCLDGWKESAGVKHEMQYARRHGKKVILAEVLKTGQEIAHTIGQIGDAPIT